MATKKELVKNLAASLRKKIQEEICIKDNKPDGTCWSKLRELFALDYHRNNVRYPILSTDPNDDTEFQNKVVGYFREKGYKLRVRRPRDGDSVHIKLMKYWLEVPRDLAMKIMVLGEVPDLSELHKTPDALVR